MFAAAFAPEDIPVYLAPAFGGIALATAPAPAFSIVQAFHTKGPVTDTLLPMAVLDDVGRMPAVNYPDLSYRFEVGACNCPVV